VAIEEDGLAGCVAVVTGASSGIGRACALALAQRGAKVALLNRDSQSAQAQSALAEVRQTGTQALSLSCDTSETDAVIFLAGRRSAYVNGADLVADGRFTRNLMSMIPRTAQ